MTTGNTIFDPLRKKDVALTPEERVRQWFIGVLRDVAKVPMHMMNSEVEIRFGTPAKLFRADIVVFGRDGHPAAIVECKRPDVQLTKDVLEQALRYDMVLGVRYIVITNGNSTHVFALADGRWSPVAELPDYATMTI